MNVKGEASVIAHGHNKAVKSTITGILVGASTLELADQWYTILA
jgi:hypothetical protein